MAFRMNTGLRSKALTGATRGRAAGIGTGFAQLTLLAQQSRQARRPLVLVASGDRCIHSRMPQWIRWVTRAQLASLVVSHQARLEANLREEQKVARELGELSAFWAVENTTPQVAQANRREALVMARRELAAHKVAEIRTAIRRFWHKMLEFNGHHEETHNRHIPYMQYGQAVTVRCEEFFIRRAAGIPATFFVDESLPNWIQAMTEYDIQTIRDLPEGDLVLQADLAPLILDLDDDHFIALLDFLAQDQYDYYYTRYLCSLLVAVTTLCKQGNVTEKWVERHTDLFRSHFGNEGITAIFTTPVVMAYAQYYPVANITPQDMYVYLCIIYSQLADANASVVNWVIEQAAAANVTSLTCLAHALGQGKRFDLEIFKSAALGIPEEEFAAYAEAALHTINEPFCSLVAPPVTSDKYADLAYIGYKIATYMDPNSSYTGYTNSLANHIQRSVKALDEFAKKIANRITAIPDLDDIIQQLVAMRTKLEVHRRDDHMYFNIIGNPDIPEGLQLEGRLATQEIPVPAFQDQAMRRTVVDEAREDYGARKAEERRARAATRADWPKEYKTFSVQSGRMSITALEDWLANHESVFSRHLHMVLAAVRATSMQQKLTPPDWTTNTLGGRYRAIDENLRAALAGLKVQNIDQKYHAPVLIQLREPGEQEYFFQELLVAVHQSFNIENFFKRKSASMLAAYAKLNQPDLDETTVDIEFSNRGIHEWMVGEDADNQRMSEYYNRRGHFRTDDEAVAYNQAHPQNQVPNRGPPGVLELPQGGLDRNAPQQQPLQQIPIAGAQPAAGGQVQALPVGVGPQNAPVAPAAGQGAAGAAQPIQPQQHQNNAAGNQGQQPGQNLIDLGNQVQHQQQNPNALVNAVQPALQPQGVGNQVNNAAQGGQVELQDDLENGDPVLVDANAVALNGQGVLGQVQNNVVEQPVIPAEAPQEQGGLPQNLPPVDQGNVGGPPQGPQANNDDAAQQDQHNLEE